MGLRRPPPRRPTGLTNDMIARDLAPLIGLPIGRHRRMGKPYEIVKTVLKVMADALRRGETVRVHGFGTFVIRTRVPRNYEVTYFYGRTFGPRIPITTPPKHYVHFQPSKALTKFVNEAPNHGKT